MTGFRFLTDHNGGVIHWGRHLPGPAPVQVTAGSVKRKFRNWRLITEGYSRVWQSASSTTFAPAGSARQTYHRWRLITESGAIVWQNAGLSLAPTVLRPDAPVFVDAVDMHDATVVLTIQPGANGGAAVNSSFATGSLGDNGSVGGTSNTIIVNIPVAHKGLLQTWSVTQTNAQGTSDPTLSNALSPVTPPGVLTGVVAVPGDAQISLSGAPPVDTGGLPIIGYIGIAASGQSSIGAQPRIVGGLPNNVLVSGTMKAVNAYSTGPESASSNTVTPQAGLAPPVVGYMNSRFVVIASPPRKRTKLPKKDPEETVIVTFDFTADLGPGEIIFAPLVTADVLVGEDTNPAAMIDGTAQVSGPLVAQFITGGLNGTNYRLQCKVSTNSSYRQTIVKAGSLPVRES